MHMTKINWLFCGVLFVLAACDLRPKIVSLPDSVGDFISARYPALLADPNAEPEIYNSAVSDYGMYASPQMYGTYENQDYVMYASVDDYVIPTQDNLNADTGDEIIISQKQENTDQYLIVPMYGGQSRDIEHDKTDDFVTVESGDTLYKISKKYNTTVDELAGLNDLSQPYLLSVGQKLRIKQPQKTISRVQEKSDDVLNITKPQQAVQNVTRVQLKDITVARGDTLYSVSRMYAIPVNDLAVINNLKPPFTLSVGQKLRVPDLEIVSEKKLSQPTEKKSDVAVKEKQGVVDNKKTATVQEKQTNVKATEQKDVVAKKQQPKKISSDPSKKLPKIVERSSSKFSWPLRGKILSDYGAKSNGLFNDGINISGTRGANVVAAENGVVAYAGNEVKGMGNLIIIQHSGGWMTVYAHLDSMNVKRGSKVSVKQKIGTVGETGKVDKPQLHFEIRKGTKAYNPNVYLKK